MRACVVAALVAAAGAVGIAQIGNTVLLEPDSASYIGFSADRGLGYPSFLYLLRSAGIPLEGVPWVQLSLHLATIPLLFGVLRRCIGNLWLPSLIVLLSFANPEVAKYHAQILSESLFLTVLVLYVAFLLSFLRESSPRNLLLVSTAVVLGVAIKPVGWAFVVLLSLVVVAGLVRERGRMALLAAFMLPPIAVAAVQHAASRAIHGPVRASLAPLHLFAKAGMVDAAVPDALLTDGPNAPLHRALERDADAIRRLIERAPERHIERFLSVNYEVFLQYRFGLDVRRSIAAQRDLGAAMFDTGFERLRHGWMSYLALTWRPYLSLWLLYDASHPAHYEAVNAFIAAERPLPYEKSAPALVEPIKSAGLKALVARPLVAAAGIVTAIVACLGAYCLVRPKEVPMLGRQAGLLALGLHGYCLLVALTGVGIPRYLLGVWPLLVCAAGLACAAALPWLRNAARRAAQLRLRGRHAR